MDYFQYLMKFLAAFSIVFSLLIIKSLSSPPNLQEMNYLQGDDGYIHSTPSTSNLVSLEIVSNAIKNFQRFAGLTVIGNLDDTTQDMMENLRCSVKDIIEQAGSNRKKPSNLKGNRQHVNVLSYRIHKYPRNLQKALADSEIAQAFQAWSNVTNIDFIVEESGNEEPHINIRFQSDDEFLNDDAGRQVAFAYSPNCGDIVFNDELEWTTDGRRGASLFQVAVHEIGHSLGLVHSDVHRSVMAPFYFGYDDPETRLQVDDIQGIQSLYERSYRSSLVIRPNMIQGSPDPSGPNLCEDPSIDAATVVEDGRAFVFKGNYYWQIEDMAIINGPRKIFDDWDGMPGNIDAALTWTDGKTYLFKNNLVYRFENQEMDYGYPEAINIEFPGIPDNLDAAFLYSGNGKTYFFKGDMYWRYESGQNFRVMTSFFPHTIISNWNDLPTPVDSALTYNQKTYFFKGRYYYNYDDKTNSLEEQLSTSEYWLDC